MLYNIIVNTAPAQPENISEWFVSIVALAGVILSVISLLINNYRHKISKSEENATKDYVDNKIKEVNERISGLGNKEFTKDKINESEGRMNLKFKHLDEKLKLSISSIEKVFKSEFGMVRELVTEMHASLDNLSNSLNDHIQNEK